MHEQDDESLGSDRESSSFDLRIRTARSRTEVRGILHEHEMSKEDFTSRFPVLAKATLGLPDEAAPPV
ncbi:hypothetical protein AB0467_19175 [Streptomyces sp. NPDC052095]|uniref:hypothetical protein n=1 Tax=unclassified Streptomyces TaxID=2593676 RepID=UPI00344EB046